jgi:hypothetical protein
MEGTMIETSPERMAALAANASAALELLEDGVRTAPVLSGLGEGEQFCVFLERGAVARVQSESFSAAGLAAGEFVGFVNSTELGKELTSKVQSVLEQVRMLRNGLTKGTSKIPPSIRLAELRDYFYRFSRTLAQHEALRERLARDLESDH